MKIANVFLPRSDFVQQPLQLGREKAGAFSRRLSEAFAPPAAARMGEMSHFVVLGATGDANLLGLRRS